MRIGAAVVDVATTITARHRPLIYAHVMPGMQAAAKLFGELTLPVRVQLVWCARGELNPHVLTDTRT